MTRTYPATHRAAHPAATTRRCRLGRPQAGSLGLEAGTDPQSGGQTGRPLHGPSQAGGAA